MKKDNTYPEYLHDVREIIERDKRHAALIWKDKEAERFAKEHDLEILEFSFPEASLDTSGCYIIGKKEIVRNLISSGDLVVSIPEIVTQAMRLYEQIKDLKVVDALKFLLEQPFEGALETPEVALLEGVFYGYALCDIEYYIKTRYFREPQHSYEEQAAEKSEHVLCEKCAREKISEG